MSDEFRSHADIAPRRNRFQFRLATLLLLVTVSAVFTAWAIREPPPPLPDLSKPIDEIRLSLGTWPHATEIQIVDQSLIKSLFAEPLGKANKDSMPAAYPVLGGASIRYSDGTHDGIAIFLPWGHFKYRESYAFADFSRLQAHVKQILPNAPPYLFDQVTP